jgi:transcriptional regulator with XRE-family HTH domain
MRLEVIVGQNVRRLRLARALSQEALAAEVGVDMRYLGGIERGQENPTIKVVGSIAKALGVHPSGLLVESRSKN